MDELVAMIAGRMQQPAQDMPEFLNYLCIVIGKVAHGMPAMEAFEAVSFKVARLKANRIIQ